MTQEEIKAKYSLAIDTIKLPCCYDKRLSKVFDKDNNLVLDIRGWGRIQYLSEPVKRQNQIGELIVELLNNLNNEIQNTQNF